MTTRRNSTSSDHQKVKCNALVAKIDCLVRQNQQLRLGSTKIKKIMEFVKKWRTCCLASRSTKVYTRRVLYFLLERMFLSRFNDSQDVVLLLSLLFEIEGHLYCAIVRNIEICPSLTFVGVYEFSEYFIRHAYQEKAIFGGCRLLNTDIYDSFKWHSPVEMAASIPDPILLLQMLRYGALLSGDEYHMGRKVKRFRYGGSSLMAVISTLSSIVKLNPNILTLDDLELNTEEKDRYKRYIRCCELLLKDCPSWPISFIHAVGGLKRKKSMLDFIEIFSTNVIRDFKKHFIVPMDLKKACRLSIRRILNQKWNLPQGINNLVIPESLKIYLDS